MFHVSGSFSLYVDGLIFPFMLRNWQACSHLQKFLRAQYVARVVANYYGALGN